MAAPQKFGPPGRYGDIPRAKHAAVVARMKRQENARKAREHARIIAMRRKWFQEHGIGLQMPDWLPGPPKIKGLP